MSLGALHRCGELAPERLSQPARARLEREVGAGAPALTYAFIAGDGAVSTFAAGRGDAASPAAINPLEALPLYSMTKTITALATLELLERQGLALTVDVRELLADFPFRQQRVSVAQLLSHTSGLPNPLPLRWVHPSRDHAGFDEAAARVRSSAGLRVGRANARYRYSNLGYWWLGAVVERLAGKPFTSALEELGLPATTAYPAEAHAFGHVRRFGALRTVAQLLLPRWVLAGPAGKWMRIARHHVDGVAYGGLLGSAAEIVPLLRRLVAIARGEAGEGRRRAVLAPYQLENDRTAPMTCALHVGNGFLFKEGGGAGFHSELRLYPSHGAASVLIANSSELDVKHVLTEIDALCLAGSGRGGHASADRARATSATTSRESWSAPASGWTTRS